jgi:hypothetical protein
MLRSFLLVCAIGVTAAQPAVHSTESAATHPVREVTERPKAYRIQLVSFEFQQPQLYGHLTVHYRPIEGQPAMGEQYGVHASLGGEEAIATLLFEAIDADGATIQPIPMAHHSITGDYGFIGMLTVPSRPFRVRLSGEDVFGQRFTLTYPRLFTPTIDAPQSEFLPPEIRREAPPEFVRHLEQTFDDVRAERRAIAVANPSGRIVMPRTRVMNVRYAPFRSHAGRPLGLRIMYDVEFSQAGRYNPEVRIYAEDKEDTAIGRNPLHTLRSTIRPLPHETYAPLKEAEEIPGLLAQRADFLYEAGTRYTFMVEMVPDFVKVLRDGVTPCVWKQAPLHSPHEQRAFARRLARREPTTYTVWIGGDDTFEGKIDGFYGEGTLYDSVIAEGFAECEYPEFR